MPNKDSYKTESPLMEELDAICEGKSKLDLAEEIWKLRGPNGESPDQWYERERAAFIAWWESGGQKKFGATPTLAAGAGWLARAEAASPATSESRS